MSKEARSIVDEMYEVLLDPEASTEKISAYYDEWAKKYNKDVDDLRYEGPSALVKIFSNVCSNKKAAILDWGSGTGLVGAKLSENGYTDLTGVDISQKSLDVAAESGVYRQLLKLGDSKTLFEDDEFDGIACSGCILPNHVSPEIFYEWVRIVKPGGIIAISMRRAHIRLTKGEESFLSEELKTEFERVVEDLQKKNKWELVSETESTYLAPNVPGIVFIYKIT